MFPKISIEEIAKLSKQEIRDLIAQIADAAKGVEASAMTPEVAEDLKLAAEARKALEARLSSLTEAELALAELTADGPAEDVPAEIVEPAAGSDEAGDDDGEPAGAASEPLDIAAAISQGVEAAVDKITAALTASQTKTADELTDETPSGSSRTEPIAASSSTGTALAVTVTSENVALTEADAIKLFVEGVSSIRQNARLSDGDKKTLLSMAALIPAERQMGLDVDANSALLAQLVGPQALTAAGGICNPYPPDYRIGTIGSPIRPIASSIPSVFVERGGMVYYPPITAAGLSAAVGRQTLADDAANVAKTCYEPPCPTTRSAEIELFYRCLTFKNVSSRALPEMVAANLRMVMVAWAILTETRLLEQIKGFSKKATVAETLGTQNYGIMTTLPPAFLRAADYYRSFYREPGMQFRVLLPEWVKTLGVIDMDRNEGSRFEWDESRVDSVLSRNGINITYYWDTPPTGASQVFSGFTGTTSVAAPIADYPSTIQGAFFPEGEFLRMDMGTLDLGLVRDSTLNSTNRYQIFFESFEGLAHMGLESIWFEAAYNLSGHLPAPVPVLAADTAGLHR